VNPVKPTEAVDDEAATAEVETSETAGVDATKSVESTKVKATEMASSEVTTAEMATAGIRDFGQRNHGRNERCGDERDKFATHDTLLLDGDLLAATEVLQKWQSCGFFSRIYRSAHQHRVRGTMVSPMSRCSTTCQSLHSRTRRRCGSISRRSGGRCRRGRGVSSCAAASVENPATASANTAKPVIDRRMALPQFGSRLNVSHHGAVVNHAL
jgi:hypothetical protein